MTNAQKKAEADRIRNVRNMRNWAYVVLIVGLLASLSANVMQSWALGPIGWAIAASAPIALFVCMALLERIGNNVHIAKRVIMYAGMGGASLIAGWVSYWHIHDLVLSVTGNAGNAYILPGIVDLPMILASVLLSEARKTLAPTRVPTTPVRRSATATAVVRGTVVKPSRTRTTKITKPEAVTA